jgi:transcriptional regulator with XRE-family HTH domain
MDLATFTETLPKVLRFLRHNAEMTQEEVAKGAGITPSMVSNYERGKELPSLHTLLKLLTALQCDLCDLDDAIRILSEHWAPESKEARRKPTRSLFYALLEEADLPPFKK